MYHLKPILKPVDIELPTCMYPLKPLNGACLNNNQMNASTVFMENFSQKLKSLLLKEDASEIQALELKQHKVLSQLNELREQLLAMRAELNSSGTTEDRVKVTESPKPFPKPTKLEMQPINLSYLQDFVVNASPNNIPFGLLVLKKLWIDRLDLQVECFTHSTIQSLSEEAIHFQNVITNFGPASKDGGALPHIKVTLIWKNVGAYTEMITSPTAYVPICGEVNILRFLSRCGPTEFNYEQSEDVLELDSILDACYLLINKQNVKDKKQVLKVISSKLGKTANFGGTEISLCDIAVTSAIRQVQKVLAKDINPNLAKLIARVGAVAGM